LPSRALTLARLKTRIAFTNHKNFAAPTHNLAIRVAIFG